MFRTREVIGSQGVTRQICATKEKPSGQCLPKTNVSVSYLVHPITCKWGLEEFPGFGLSEQLFIFLLGLESSLESAGVSKVAGFDFGFPLKPLHTILHPKRHPPPNSKSRRLMSCVPVSWQVRAMVASGNPF